MDPLFEQFRHGEFRGGRFGDQDTSWDLNAVTSEASSIGLHAAGIAQDIGAPPWQGAQGLPQLENSFFYDGPPDTSIAIVDTTNKLPGWFTTASGGSTAKWAANAVILTNGGSSGLVTLSKTILVPESGAQGWVCEVEATAVSSATSNNQAKLDVQFYQSDGTTTTGAAGSDLATLTALNAQLNDTKILRALPNTTGVVPSNAVYVKVSFALDANAAGGSNTVTFPQVILRWHGRRIAHADNTDAGTYSPFWQYQDSGHPFGLSNGRYGGAMVGGFGVFLPVSGITPASTSGVDITLAAQYDALVAPLEVTSEAQGYSYVLRQGSAASLRTAAVRLYYDAADDGTALVFVPGSDAAFSFTPGAADNRTATMTGVSVQYVKLIPGHYWVVVQNTSATQSFVVRGVAAGDLSGTISGYRTKAIGSAIGSTLAVSGWTAQTAIPMVVVAGNAWGLGAAW